MSVCMLVDPETAVFLTGSLLLALVGLALLWGGIRQYRHQRGAVRRAETAQGTVESVGVQQIATGSQTAYVPTLSYEYRTPTQRLRGEQLYPGRSQYTKLFDSESTAEKALEGYEPGASTTVYYDPEAPDHSFLEPSPHGAPSLARIAFGTGLIALGGVLLSVSGVV